MRFYRKVTKLTDLQALHEEAQRSNSVGVGVSKSGDLYLYKNNTAVKIVADEAALILGTTVEQISALQRAGGDYVIVDPFPEPVIEQIIAQPEPEQPSQPIVAERMQNPQPEPAEPGDTIEGIVRILKDMFEILHEIRAKVDLVPEVSAKLDGIKDQIENFYL